MVCHFTTYLMIIKNFSEKLRTFLIPLNEDYASLIRDCLDVDLNAIGNLTIMAEELIINERKVEAYEQLAGCQAYTNHLTRLAAYGSDVF